MRKWLALGLGTLGLGIASLPAAQPQVHVTDVVVYGATPAGVCAAVAAAREGASVSLVESSALIGGVNSGGLSHSDSNQTLRRAAKGLFEEFHQRIAEDYARRGVKLDYDVAVKDHSRWTYEPHVAERVAIEMLREAGVAVYLRQNLVSAKKEGARITEISTETRDVFRGKAFVDSTYEGDLMAAAGVSWTIGREGRKEFGESLAGKQYPKPVMPISGLAEDGKRLPLITDSEAGDEMEGDRGVMTYSFRLCLTKEPGNRIPFPKPAHYNPNRFEAVRRYLAWETKPVLLWDLYPIPGGKVDANNGIGKQFSMGLVGASNGWSEATAEEREKIWEAHKQYTLEFYEFLTTDPAVPQPLREQLAEYGLCKDEFAAYGHWSPQLYVREGRRLRGVYILKQADILTSPQKEDSIGVSSFPIDSHDVRRVSLGGDRVANEGTILPVRIEGTRQGYAYEVPYGTLLPKRNECENLLVPVALSATHVAYSSIRVEPTWMMLGQSAGVAAAMAAQSGEAVQGLPYSKLRDRLLHQKQVLDLEE